MFCGETSAHHCLRQVGDLHRLIREIARAFASTLDALF